MDRVLLSWETSFASTFAGLLLATDYLGGDADDSVAPLLATEHLGLRWAELPWELEGGNLLVDGAGTCVVSTTVINDNPTVTLDEFEHQVDQLLGCRRLLVLPPVARGSDRACGYVHGFQCAGRSDRRCN